MKNNVKILLATSMLFCSSLAFAHTEETTVTTTTTEVNRVEQAAECVYSNATHDQCMAQVFDMIQNQKTLIQNVKDANKQKDLYADLDKIEKKVEKLNKASSKKKESMYKEIVAQLQALSAKIETANA